MYFLLHASDMFVCLMMTKNKEFFFFTVPNNKNRTSLIKNDVINMSWFWLACRLCPVHFFLDGEHNLFFSTEKKSRNKREEKPQTSDSRIYL